MSCSNCYNGCTEIVSDKCVKYTGIDVPILGITNGDTLLHVEQTLINFLVPMLNGTGIIPDISNSIICEVVSKYLPTCSTCTGFTLKDILIALIKAACDLQEQIVDLQEQIDEIESPYTIDCLSGTPSNTHDVLQATINKLCEIDSDLVALALDLSINYVQISDLDTLIQNYINDSGQNTLIKNRMVPFAVVPYYGPTTYFDGSGKGIGDWDRIFLCNGVNPGVPDLRGRTLVGVTDGTMLGGTMSNAVNPGISGNPTYALGTPAGSNQVTLDLTQIPNHTHIITNSTNVNDPEHRHKFSDDVINPTDALRVSNDIIPVSTSPSSAIMSGTGSGSGRIYQTSAESTGITIDVNSSASFEGGGLPHSNIQPSIGCRYIIYIP
jgi:microcystin-dependent protein